MKQIKVTAIHASGCTIITGWWSDIARAEQYYSYMTRKGYVCAKEFRTVR